MSGGTDAPPRRLRAPAGSPGSTPAASATRAYATVVRTKPSGTGKPAWMSSPRFAPLPPAAPTSAAPSSRNERTRVCVRSSGAAIGPMSAGSVGLGRETTLPRRDDYVSENQTGGGDHMTGKLVHFEIPAKNGDRARKFYASLLGWKLKDAQVPGLDYFMSEGMEPVAAVFTSPEQKGPVIYFDVDDIDKGIREARA